MRFLLTKRWIGFGAFVVVLAVLCALLGRWQFHRAEERDAMNEQVRAHVAADPVPIDEVVPDASAWPADAEWTRVVATGTFDTTRTVTVRYLKRGGSPGVDVVVPFMLDSGGAILVDAGWFATQNSGERPSTLPTLPEGRTTIEGWLRANSDAGDVAVVPDQGQVRAISSAAWDTPYGLREGYLNLQSPQIEGLAPEPLPDLDTARNISYGLQWWFFAILAIGGFGWFIRAERKQNADQASATMSA